MITCVITSNAPCVTGSPANSNEIQEIVNPILAASITISANPSGEVCEGTSVSFTAFPVNGGSAPSLQWFSNGDIITGAVSPVFSSALLDDNEVISCSLTSSLNCVSGSPALSNLVTQQVVSPVSAVVSIAVSPEGSVCQGSQVTFTATPVNGGTTPLYQWRKNGVDIDGATNSNFISSSLENGDAISCVMISNEPCVSGSPASSNAITANINGGSGSSQTFSYTGAAETFIVPTCVLSVNIQVWGAQGGTSFYNGNPLAGAIGGYATGDLAVTPGQILGVYVGRQGASNNSPSAGWNGGACGGNGNNGYGGGGGDGTDVRVGGVGFSNRVIVAGGGGGAWTNPSFPVGSGGAGGGTNGDGWAASQAQGGTQTQGGQISPWTEFSGGFGYGGTYDNTPWPNGCGNGGGGGGGWYGGSAASGCCAGPGGGGSGYIGGVSNGSMQSGVRSGNGQVIISW
ncbi:MAG: hypothetical protein IT223_01300 [Crocinitomicaceae bacterium]|nr:hypothetical protein [Crocinitomicaceae bacterium]